MINQLWVKLWKREGAGFISDKTKRQLQDRFKMDNTTLNGLKFMSRPGSYAGRRTRYIRIYDPSTLISKVRQYSDLKNQTASLLFEGRLTRGVFDSVSDLRKNKGKEVKA